MKIYEYKKDKLTLLYCEHSKYNGLFVRELEAKETHRDFCKKTDKLNVGDIVYVNKFGADNQPKGFRAEIISLEIDSRSMPERLNKCNTINDLDGLRLEIASDKDSFLENQKLFIATKNRIKRIRN